MHRSVLQNKKYIEFSSRYTVEVMALGRLDEGVQAEDPKAATYVAKTPEGEDVEYMLEFPGLTYDEMVGLRGSKASRYNDTGKIPFTCLVDPHTLEEIERWSGGQSSNTLITAVMKATRDLTSEYGEGLDRAELQKVDGAVAEAKRLAREGSFKKAFRSLDKLVEQDSHEVLKSKVSAGEQAVLASARQQITELRELAASDASKAKRELGRLMRELKGTDLGESVQDAIDSIGS